MTHDEYFLWDIGLTGKHAWYWFPCHRIYTPTLWEQVNVTRLSGSALELTEMASVTSEDDG